MIHLEKIDDSNYKHCLKLSVGESQKGFVCSNAESLAKAYVFYDSIHPFAIFYEDVMVGFVILRYHEQNQSYFLLEFMIDKTYQRKGYGKGALKKLLHGLENRRM